MSLDGVEGEYMPEEKQPEEEKEKRRAVIVGINEYMDENIIGLTGAANDAKDIYERLKNPNIGKFEVSNAHYLLDENATCKQIRKAISDIFWKTDRCDLALFYFSGYWFEDGYGNGYIAPYDMLKDEPFVNGISMQELKFLFSNPVNKVNVIILDCCYTGFATKDDKSIPDKSIPNNFFENLGEGRYILASSGGDQVSKEITLKHEIEQESHSHGAFTVFLIEGLDGKASNEYGLISLYDLYNYAQQQLENKRISKAKLYAADASRMSDIKIAVVSSKSKAFIKKEIEEIENLFSKKDPSCQIEAAKLIYYVLGVEKKNEKALNLKNKISNALTEYHNDIKKWLLRNQMDIRLKLLGDFPKILKLVDDLQFDKIPTLDKSQLNLILICYSASIGEIDIPDLITHYKLIYNPSGISKQSGDAFRK